MERDNDRARTFTRRAFIVGALQAGFLGLLSGRLAWLQIAQGQRYRVLAENNRINLRMLLPSRGLIVDRNDVAMAVNTQNFRVMVVPEQTQNLETAISRVQKLIPVSQRDIQRVLKQAEKAPAFMPLEIRDSLEWQEVAKIEVNLPDLPGVSIDEGEIRHYPYGGSAVHLVGYVGAVSKADMTADPVMSLPDLKIGKTGLEKTYDLKLRGTAGSAEVEVNVLGREVRELNRAPGRPGSRVRLSIDADLQRYVHERLGKEQSASAVVMDALTGAVYALASWPGFDPNSFTHGIPADMWEELLANPGLPLNNKAVAGQYPPGSTFKMVTAMAALEAGVITRDTGFFCPGHYDLGKERFHCWKKGGHGRVDVTKALTESCDVFFYNIARDLGVDRLADCARKLGFGEKLNIELSEERPGLMPNRAWKKAQMGDTWHPGESIIASIGQGYILATPLQLAVMTARLVNGGKKVSPWLTYDIDGVPVRAPQDDNISLGFRQKNMDIILEGMRRVVNMPGGTAYGSRMPEEQFQMGGKTGTAQVKRISRQDRIEGVQNQDLPWKYRHHALFVGYAPVSSPRYVCSVVVEHGVGGALTAAPMAKDILMLVQQRDPASKQPVPAVLPEGSSDKAAEGREPETKAPETGAKLKKP